MEKLGELSDAFNKYFVHSQTERENFSLSFFLYTTAFLVVIFLGEHFVFIDPCYDFWLKLIGLQGRDIPNDTITYVYTYVYIYIKSFNIDFIHFGNYKKKMSLPQYTCYHVLRLWTFFIFLSVQFISEYLFFLSTYQPNWITTDTHHCIYNSCQTLPSQKRIVMYLFFTLCCLHVMRMVHSVVTQRKDIRNLTWKYAKT